MPWPMPISTARLAGFRICMAESSAWSSGGAGGGVPPSVVPSVADDKSVRSSPGERALASQKSQRD